MKIECVKEKIISSITLAEKMTGKNLTLPILSCIHLKASGSELTIKATNLDLGIEIVIPVKVIEEGSVVVPGSVLVGLLQNLQDDKVTLESREGSLVFSTKTTNTSLKTFPDEDFPIIPRVNTNKTVSLEANLLVTGLKSVWYSAAVTSMKPELSSVYVYCEEESIVFAATDSFRLAEKRVPVKKGKDFGNILIPYKNIPEITRTLEMIKGDVIVHFDANQIAFENEGLYVVSRVIDGTFPDYKQIIPKEFKTEVIILKQDLLSALKLSNVFSDNFNQVIMKVIPEEKIFEIATKNNTIGENKNNLEAVLTGEDIIISFNYKYIIDCFQSIHSDSLTLSFQGLSRPVMIRGVSDKSFMYIVMPMNK
jgi:DNA polymerase-3 subunit beta